MISAILKAYWRQLAGAAVAVALVVFAVVAWNVHGDNRYNAGIEQAKKDQADADAKAKKNVSRRKPMMNRKRSARLIRRVMMLCLPLSALVACSSNSTVSGSNSNNTPTLSALARQPQTPEFCLPTCSANLSNEIDNWQNTLTGQQKPGDSASGNTTP